MHLHDHLGGALLFVQRLLHSDHAHLDEVGCGALHGGVDGGALQTRERGALGVLNPGELQAATEHGFHVAHLLGHGPGFIHVFLDAGEALEVALDVVLGCGVVNAQ